MKDNWNDKFTVLLASSEESTRKKLMAVLNDDAYHTVLVESCKDALEMLIDNDFDLVIFDPDIPGLTGPDAVELIKKLRPDLPLIVATDERSYESGLKIARTGVYFRLGKPVDEKLTKELVETLKKKKD